jgi:short-subunit dehydrogenase
MQIKNKVFVLTGGGSGLGQALAIALLKQGAKVAIADINKAGMQETLELAAELKHNLSTHYLDIQDKTSVEEFPKLIIETHGQIDGLINNAGIIQPFVKVEQLDFESIERIMNINFYGTLYMIKSFLPHLLQRPEAHIVNVASMGGFIPFPGQTIYSASKAAVKLLTEGLYAELKDSSVHVTAILPGAINTNIAENSGIEMNATADAQNVKMLDPRKGAELIIKAIEKNKFRALLGTDAKFLDFMYRMNPGRAVRFIVKKMGHLLK